MAIHAPITRAPSRAPFIPALPTDPGHSALMAALLALQPRSEIEAAIEALIATLDRRDGDPDEESDGDDQDASGAAEEDHPVHSWGSGDGYPGDPDDREDDDPAGDPLDAGEMDEAEFNYLATYGVDQSAGPINERAMWRRHTGLVRAGLSDDAIRAANNGARGFRPGVTA